MNGPRAPQFYEFPNIVEFLNSQLRPQSSWSIDKEYPTALNSNNLGNIRIITEGNKVLSHAVLKPIIIKSPILIYKVGAIGSVVTDSNYRGQGLSKAIIQECILEAERQECDIAMLWTNLYDFYRKYNFELAGFEGSFVIENEFTTTSTQKLKFLKGTNVSSEAIGRLYSQHTVATVRHSEDIRKFLTIPNTELYTAWDEQGQLVAYAVEGKGADLGGYIHEWGGGVSKLMALFSWIRQEKQKPFTVIVGLHSLNLLEALKTIPGVTYNEGYLGMIKIINEGNFFAKLKRAAKTVGVSNFVLERKNNKFIFGLDNDAVEFEDEKDLVRILFGPFPEISNLKKETLEQIEKFLPLHFWVWGWDSI